MKLSKFEETLKEVQEQLKKDKQAFKQTGKVSDLMMRIDSFNKRKYNV